MEKKPIQPQVERPAGVPATAKLWWTRYSKECNVTVLGVPYRVVFVHSKEPLAGGKLWAIRDHRQRLLWLWRGIPDNRLDDIEHNNVLLAEQELRQIREERRRRCPDNALGIRIKWTSAPILAADGRRSAAQELPEERAILVDSGVSFDSQRAAVIQGRHRLAERLPAGELDALAADLADVARKLGAVDMPILAETPVPEPTPAPVLTEFALRPDLKGRWCCPICGKSYKVELNLCYHLRKTHDMHLDAKRDTWLTHAAYLRRLKEILGPLNPPKGEESGQ